MIKSASGGLQTAATADERFTYHREPPAQGGEVYARCRGCQREILRSIGEDKLEHAEGCPHA